MQYLWAFCVITIGAIIISITQHRNTSRNDCTKTQGPRSTTPGVGMGLENEQALVEQACRNPQAFRQLYNHYFPKLYTYMSYRVGRAQDAEDLTATVFMKVVEELGRFQWRHDNSFAAWLLTIAHHCVTNFRRDT